MEITVSFTSKKAYNKFLRNYQNGKGTNIKPSEVEIVGGSFLDTMRNVGSKALSIGKKAARSDIGKAILREGINVGAQGATYALASRGVPMPIAGILTNAGSNYANQQVDGMGFLSNMKSAGRSAISSGIGKAVLREGVKLGTNIARDQLAQRGYDGAITNTLLNTGNQLASQQINGMGFGGDGLHQSVNNQNQMRMMHARSFRKANGGSFRLP